MKASLFTLLALLLLPISCSKNEREVYETENGAAIPRSGDYLDNLRGASDKRDAEIMAVSREIIKEAGQTKTDEYNTPYTGRVKIYIWESGGQKKFFALKEIQWKDGTIMWQGPNPPTKYFSVKNLTEIIITDFGPENQERLKKEGIF